MKQNRLKILCAYYDSEPDFLGTHPEEALEGHHVTLVHTYHGLKALVTDTTRGMPPFDIVISDLALPSGYPEDPQGGCTRFPTVVLDYYISEALIRAFAIFLPKHSESAYESSDGYHVVVASKRCWTPLDKRDWAAMLDLVLNVIDEGDTFNTRTPEEG